MYELIQKKEQCCGCGACINICPKNAITMKEDEWEFMFPEIDSSKCIKCNLCKKVCDFQKEFDVVAEENAVYAAVNKNEQVLLSSSSGGAFTALAQWILDKSGVVYGCAWDEEIKPHIVGVETIADIGKLQGSKYVQADTKFVYQEVREKLLSDRYVLFSGTPCQCAALRSYLGKEHKKLYCVELICHGVPSSKMFSEYIALLEKKLKGKIVNLEFRNKKSGWGALLKIDYLDNNKRHKVTYLKPEESYYYYYYFYLGLFFRESCYECKYAQEQRMSDFTIGDFWGGHKIYPEFDMEKGISVLIATGEKALGVIQELEPYMYLVNAAMEDVKKENGQITHASVKSSDYDDLLKKYRTLGAEAFDAYYRATHRKEIIRGKIKRLLPIQLKRVLRKTLKSLKTK